MSETAFEAIRLIYELSEIIYYDLPESPRKQRIVKLREYIRETYDESVWKP